MNRSRGGGRQPLFHDDAYFVAFLNTLAEAQARHQSGGAWLLLDDQSLSSIDSNA